MNDLVEQGIRFGLEDGFLISSAPFHNHQGGTYMKSRKPA
jgi:hypothetical protein